MLVAYSVEGKLPACTKGGCWMGKLVCSFVVFHVLREMCQTCVTACLQCSEDVTDWDMNTQAQ